MNFLILIPLLFIGATSAVKSAFFELPPPPGTPTILVRLEKANVIVKNKLERDKRHFFNYTPDDYTMTSTAQANVANVTISFVKSKPDAGAAVNPFELKMGFTKGKDKYWQLDGAIVSLGGSVGSDSFNFKDRKMVSELELVAPVKTSYHCGKFGLYMGYVPPDKEERNYTININLFEFQVQPFDLTTTPNAKFGPYYECTGYFSPGIWMGIFVNIILGIIMIWGISMIMSVKTMDRFDDMKRPISVGATSD